MDEWIAVLTEQTKEKFGLNDYYLERYDVRREVNVYNQTSYYLVME